MNCVRMGSEYILRKKIKPAKGVFLNFKKFECIFFQRKHNEYQFVSKKPINGGKYSECKQFP